MQMNNAVVSVHPKITASLLAGLFLVGIDMTVVNVILPSLSDTFAITMDTAAIIISAFVGVTAATLMFFGRCSDLWSAEKLYFIGILVFTISLLLCGISTNFYCLVFSRSLQGLGSAMAASASGAVIIRNYPKEKIGSILGAMMMALGIGNALGPVFGGLMIRYASWHWVFLIQIPLGLLSCYLMGRKGVKKNEASQNIGLKLDWQGTVLSIIGLPLLLAFLSETTTAQWDNPTVYLYLFGSILCGSLFFYSEKKHPFPLVRFSAFHNADFSIPVLTKILVLIVMQGWFFVFPFFLIRVSGFTVDLVGIVFMALSGSMLLTTPLAGRLVDRGYPRQIMTVSILIVLSVLISALFLSIPSTCTMLFPMMIIFGTGMAAFLVSSSTLILKSAPRGEEGMFSAINMVLMPLSTAIGSTVFSGLYIMGQASEKDPVGFYRVIFTMIGIICINFIFSLKQPKSKSVQ